MKEKLADRLAKLLAIKSIVTVFITVVFCILSLRGVISSELFMSIFAVVIAFYFGTQAKQE